MEAMRLLDRTIINNSSLSVTNSILTEHELELIFEKFLTRKIITNYL